MANNSVSVDFGGDVTRKPASFLFRLFDRLADVSHVKKIIIRSWYQYLSGLDKDASVTFLNYGYAQLNPQSRDIELRPEDQSNRYCIQLYQRVSEPVELRGKNVLEIGCGRGGGASFITRYRQPSSMTGVDFSSKAIAFCQNHYQDEGLSFLHGDAEKLPLPANSFDVVINVESAHCYNSMERFLREVTRVLRPGGHFLFADLREQGTVPLLREQLKRAGLRVLEEELINQNVLKALELDNERKLTLIRSKTPKFMRGRVEEFAGLMGSPVYKRFMTGEWEYMRFALQKV
ncbi:MAG: class I SAM-dependent methyltransferase [Pyrinomonadaceae bacterium]|nr:class I SAM-dependent methyltransferase [Pyrinomonadaceae bacterium]